MIDVLHVCEFSLQFFTRKEELVRFQRKQLPKNRRHPPGNGTYDCNLCQMLNASKHYLTMLIINYRNIQKWESEHVRG